MHSALLGVGLLCSIIVDPYYGTLRNGSLVGLGFRVEGLVAYIFIKEP